MSSFQFLDQTCGGKQCPTVLHAGETCEVMIKIKNTGGDTWSNTGANAVKLGTSSPRDHHTSFYDSSDSRWLSDNRVKMQESSVAPNGTATFLFNVKASDLHAGKYQLYMEPVKEGVEWIGPNAGINVPILVPAKWGVFMFGWYGSPTDITDKLYGWYPANTPGDATAVYKDEPVGGRYNSEDPDTIRNQLDQIKYMGFKFIVLDIWWDTNTGGTYGTKTRQTWDAIWDIITTEPEYQDLKMCPLIEPQPGNNSNHVVPSACYDYFYAYANAFPDNFMKHPDNGKYLMVTFMKRVGGSDTRFHTLAASTNNAAGSSFNFYALPNPTVTNNYTSLIHRIDTRQVNPMGIPLVVSNPTYGESIWNQQFEMAKRYRDTLKLCFYYGLNENRERATAEDHDNPDSHVPTDYVKQDIHHAITHQWDK